MKKVKTKSDLKIKLKCQNKGNAEILIFELFMKAFKLNDVILQKSSIFFTKRLILIQ